MFSVAVGVELELTAAEGDFLIAFRVVSGFRAIADWLSPL
jgi:hypothetical protein